MQLEKDDRQGGDHPRLAPKYAAPRKTIDAEEGSVKAKKKGTARLHVPLEAGSEEWSRLSECELSPTRTPEDDMPERRRPKPRPSSSYPKSSPAGSKTVAASDALEITAKAL